MDKTASHTAAIAEQPIEIYQTADGQTQVEVRFEQETVWLSQAQMVVLFGRDVSVISRHIRNALDEGEIDEKSNLQKMQIAFADRPVTFYDLETIISVGYRIKSAQGVAFRRWATGRLKDYLLKGYAINHKRLQQNAAAGLKAQLVARGEATDLFARERGEGLEALLGNLEQSVFGEPGLSEHRKQSCPSAVFCGQKPPVFRRQQTQRRIFVCRFSAPQRQIAGFRRPPCHQ